MLIAATSCFRVKLFIQLTDSWEEDDVVTADVEIAVPTDVADVRLSQFTTKV